MKSKQIVLLTREKFKEACFKRDNHTCVFCNLPAVDAHHILDRKLFSDGGCYLDNAASFCEHHHMKCETTEISLEDLYKACGIQTAVLPEGFDPDLVYDKWGNIIIGPDSRKPGPLFHDTAVQKIFKSTGRIWIFFNH